MKKHKSFSEKKQLKLNIIRCAAIVLAIAVVFVAVFIVLSKLENNGNSDESIVSPQLSENIKTFEGKEYTLKKNVDVYLVMGLDEYSENISSDEDAVNNNQEADFLMLFVLDNNNSTINALHINRDTMSNMDTFGVDGTPLGRLNQQIALAHTYGQNREDSCKNTIDAVKGVLDNIDIDGYISVPMDSVAEINDIVGGVEVEVLQDLTAADPALKMGETVTLKSEQALAYVRTRYGLDDSSNKARMERQKQYVEALFSKLYTAFNNDDTVINELVNSDTVNNMCARYPGQLDDIARKLMKYEFQGVFSLDGEYKVTPNDKNENNMEFYPHQKSIDEVLIKILYNPVQDKE